jgi:magnesium-transporting ATPase (P-type)
MATLHRPVDAPAVVFVKGAPEQVLAMCRDQQGAEGLQALDAAYWLEQIDALAAKGYRVLGLASRARDAGTAWTWPTSRTSPCLACWA